MFCIRFSSLGEITLCQWYAYRINMVRNWVKNNVFRLYFNPKKFGLLLEKGKEKD